MGARSLFLFSAGAMALNSVLFKRMLNCYRSSPELPEPHDYALFVSIFDIFLWACFMSVASCCGGLSSGATFPKGGVMLVAALDQLGTLLATRGATYVPGQMQVLINQAVLPLTMLMSMVRGRRYNLLECFGASVVLLGSCVAAGVFTGGSNRVTLKTGALPSAVLIRAVVSFSLAQFAVAGAVLAKEELLKRASTRRGGSEPLGDPVALGVAVAWIRVPLGFAFGLLLYQGDSTPVIELLDGWACFWGGRPRPGDDGCAAAARTTLVSVTLYAAQTILCLRLTQRCGATLRSIAGVTAVPLSQLLFTLGFIMGGPAAAESFTLAASLGLLLCLVGFTIFARGSVVK